VKSCRCACDRGNSHCRVVALERLRLEDARELSRLQAAGDAATAAGARLAAVVEAMMLGAAAQHRRQQQHASKPEAQSSTLSETRPVTTAVPRAGCAEASSPKQRLPSRLPDPAGRLVLLQLREALDV
jgi:hypothetical protein